MSKRILVVDDDEILCELFSTGFRLAGFDVSIVYDGESAIEFLTEESVDIVTLDHDMPGISGIEVLQKLKDEHIADNAKIIFVSANDSIAHDETCQRLSDYILIKPVGFRQLTQLAQQLMAQTD